MMNCTRNQCAFGKIGIKGRHPALVDLGKQRTNPLAHTRIVAGRAARRSAATRSDRSDPTRAKTPQARPRFQIEDAFAPLLQPFDADLETARSRGKVSRMLASALAAWLPGG
jgi:hypothetical protein